MFCFCLGLSSPLTLCVGLKIFYQKDIYQKQSIVLHLIGATSEEITHLDRYKEISNCLPNLRNIKLCIIGPNIPTNECKTDIVLQTSTCQIVIDIVSVPYETYVSNMSSNKKQVLENVPDLCMAQHSGCEDLAWSKAWTPAIQTLCSKAWPCLFTGYVLTESKDGVKRLRNELKVNVVVDATLNSFRGLTPYPDAAHEGFYFINTSYFCFQGYDACDDDGRSSDVKKDQ